MPEPGIDDALGGRVREAVPEGRDLQAERWHGEVAARLFGAPRPLPTIGRYQVVERLGGGASGDVWAAIDPQLDRKVAVKVLHERASLEDSRAAMVREAKSLAKLSHPNVVPVFDAGVHDGRVFVTLELVEGETMRQWLATPRRWPEVVEVFVQAARGLHAAHIAGIVHRDFKPENVLIGNDGRVRVSDFGIARVTDTDDTAPLGDTITSTAGIGTPAYMAPEQFLGDPIDPRADQFGFCIALHEALWGERPFHGKDRVALAANVTAGRRRPPPAATDVPRWLVRLVARGLSTDPTKRFPDMAAVIRELEQRPRGRAWLGVAGAAIGLAALAVMRTDGAATQRHCESDRLAAVWNPAAATRIRDAFAATAVPGASDHAERLVIELDRFSDAWRAAHDETCAAGLDEGTRIAQQYCLQTQLLELQSMATAFARADAEVVEHTAIGGNALRAPSECLYVVPAAESPAQDPEQDLELRGAIAAARAHGDIGKLADGLVAIEQAVERAQDLGNRSLEAEALLVMAELQNPLLGSSADVDPVATLHAALLAAEAAHRPDLVALAIVASLESNLARGDYARAEGLQARARAAAAALGDPPQLVGRIDLAFAEVMVMEHHDDEASTALLERAREQFERSGPSSRRWLAQTFNLLGELAFRGGVYADARPHYTRALDIVTEDLRSHHIMVANASGNLAETYFVVGDFVTAERYFTDALTIRREVFGPESVWVAHTLGHLGDVAWERGDPERALAWYETAVAYHADRPVMTDGSEVLANVLRDLQIRLHDTWMRNGMALALVDLGRLDEALVQAELVKDAPLAEDRHHPDLTSRVDMRGVVLLAMGRTEDAIAAFEDALVRIEAKYPGDARGVALALVGLGRARVEHGDHATAVAPLQRALAILAPTPHAYPRTQAAARFALGRAWMRDPVHAERGREQVRAAIAILADAEGAARRERDAMIAWLEG